MRNKIGFIPKTWPVQPDYYKNIFGNWVAVFLTEADKEFHLELISSFYHRADADTVEILRQDKDCRRQLFYGQKFTSIKSAYEKLLPVLKKENEPQISPL